MLNHGLIRSQALAESALRVLAESPAAPVRVRLLRDVLQRPADDPDLIAAINALGESPHVQVLVKEQRPDGSWGRFHTADCSSKQKIGRTEGGVHRAVELGLPRSHKVFQKAQRYLKGILNGSIPYPDPENWPVAVPIITGATLSRFAPESPLLDATWEFWAEVARQGLPTGRYDREAELHATRELLCRSDQQGWLRLWLRLNKWLRLDNMYAVMILGSRSDRLPSAVESAYVRWLCEDRPKAMIYVDIRLDQDPRTLKGRSLHGWLMLLELLSAFPSAGRIVRPHIERLLAARNADGLWDFGIQPSCPRFSDSYRRRGVTAHDWTTRVACLLKKYMG